MSQDNSIVYTVESYYGHGRDYHCYGVYSTWERAKEAQQAVINAETTQWVFFAAAGDGVYGRFHRNKFGGRMLSEGILQIVARHLNQKPVRRVCV